MFVRKTVTGLVAGAVAASTLALAAGPAHAAYTAQPDDTKFTPVAADLVGGGSDTSQNAMFRLATEWNKTKSPKVATYAATGGGQIPVPGGAEINRPNGSGGGKTLLHGAGNNTGIDYARSSSGLSDPEKAAGLQNFPFAVDTLKVAVAGKTASNAPASLTNAQIVGIYKGDFTNWSQVGGKSGLIKPMIPQGGSGTRSFFVGELKKLNGNVDVTLAGSVAEVQEHDATPIQNDANAIAPFSEGRASLVPGALRLPAGWSADRALYNVVRGADVSKPEIQAFFGASGYVCSPAALPLIELAGFKQLASQGASGECGVATQSSTTNFTTNEAIKTSVSVRGTSTAARTAKLSAPVKAATAPRGTVTFYDGAKVIAANVALVSGQATTTVRNLTPGNRTYRAVFNPAANSLFVGSSGSGAVTVKTSSKIAVKAPKKVADKKRGTVRVTITLAGVKTKATGKVRIQLGKKTLVTKVARAGKVTIKLPKLKAGKNKLKVTWAGNGASVGSTKAFTITQAKAKKKR